MAKYISKPVEIEAWQVPATGYNPIALDVPSWVLSCVSSDGVLGRQGRVPFNPLDLLIRELDGSGAYPCAPDVFEKKYGELTQVRFGKKFDFGLALCALRKGKRVARSGWNGKAMWLALSPGSQALPAEKFWAGPNREYAEQNGGTADVLPCITMKTADGKILMGWLASQSDVLAEDWEIVS